MPAFPCRRGPQARLGPSTSGLPRACRPGPPPRDSQAKAGPRRGLSGTGRPQPLSLSGCWAAEASAVCAGAGRGAGVATRWRRWLRAGRAAFERHAEALDAARGASEGCRVCGFDSGAAWMRLKGRPAHGPAQDHLRHGPAQDHQGRPGCVCKARGPAQPAYPAWKAAQCAHSAHCPPQLPSRAAHAPVAPGRCRSPEQMRTCCDVPPPQRLNQRRRRSD